MIIGSLGPAANTAPDGSDASGACGGDKRKRVCAHRAPRCIPDGIQKHRIDSPSPGWCWLVKQAPSMTLADAEGYHWLTLIVPLHWATFAYVWLPPITGFGWDDACWSITG